MARYFGQASGRVQGVGFRFFVQQNSAALGLTGWVRNMSDGTVTMEVQGEASAVDELARRLREGNMFIRVENLIWEEREEVPEEKGFSVRY